MSNQFDTLRAANLARVGQFKNKHGAPAHARPDGSDWNVATWLCAKLGEIGEFCKERVDFEEGRIDFSTYAERAAKELADDIIYTDLLAARALDWTPIGCRTNGKHSVEQQVMTVMAVFGAYCEARKKAVRGDADDNAGYDRRRLLLGQALREMQELYDMEADFTFGNGNIVRDHKVNFTPLVAHTGVNLGEAVRRKWNEVSARVGYSGRIDAAWSLYEAYTPPDSEGGEV